MRTCLLALALCLATAAPLLAGHNDIYPPEASAKSSIDWKDGYFLIKGQPTYLTSGEMHYARIPRELWRDRIWRSKQMGFNCMQMYVFWNSTEGREGEWSFTDNSDLDAWLTMVQEAGMYAIVRVGPYSCAEWEQGGLPAWLTAKPGMTLRDTGADFMRYADRHLAQIEKIVAKHQISKGGNVILVQLENEHPRGWGTEDQDPYLHHLVEQARQNGLDIPLFLSGLHHAADPSGDTPFTPGNSPWFSTEFWTGWIGKYGNMELGALAQKIRGTWKIIAFGGAGYDYYMVHGGTNFGYSGDSLEATYDYSSPIGETGQFHNLYFPARRAAYFAQSFSKLLTGSHNDPTLATCTAADLRVTSRTNPTEGSFIMVDAFQKGPDKPAAPVNAPEIAPTASAYKTPTEANRPPEPAQLIIGSVKLPQNGPMIVHELEPRTVLLHVPWTPNASFDSVCSNVLLRTTLGATDYWVCYGNPGETGEIHLKYQKPGKTPADVSFTFPSDDSFQQIDLDSGDGHAAKILVMNTDRTSRVWLAHDQLYLGPTFVREDGGLEFPIEGGKATIFSARGPREVTQAALTAPELPALTTWTWRDASTERLPSTSTKGWGTSTGPQPMESYDGYQNRYGWYRTTLHEAKAGKMPFHISGVGGDNYVFLNGTPCGDLNKLSALEAKEGDNTLAIFCKATPRNKLFPYTGPIGNYNARGVWGGVSRDPAAIKPTVAWKSLFYATRPTNSDDDAKIDINDSTWKAVDISANPEVDTQKGFTSFRGVFTLSKEDLDSAICFKVSSHDLFLNGHRLKSSGEDVSKLLVAGKNEVCVQISSRRPESKTNLAVELLHNAPETHSQWFFHPGLTHLEETSIIGRVTNWKDFLDSTPWQSATPTTAALPTFWRTTFTYHPTAGLRETIGLESTGLKSGHVWLNGHNLGEAPQKVLMYLPECWLKDGANDLVVFDVAGSNPAQLKLARYEAFAIALKP